VNLSSAISGVGQALAGAEVLLVEANYLLPTKIGSRKENSNVPPGSGNTTSAA